MSQLRVVYPTGSAYIADPEAANDIDFLGYVSGNLDEVFKGYLAQGFSDCSNLGEYDNLSGGNRRIGRKGRMNAILLNDPLEFLLWAAATELAKALDINDKAERIDLFVAIRTLDRELAASVVYAHTEEMNAATGQYLAAVVDKVKGD